MKFGSTDMTEPTSAGCEAVQNINVLNEQRHRIFLMMMFDDEICDALRLTT